MYLIQQQEEEKLVLKKEIDLNKATLRMNKIIITAILILFLLVLAFSVYLIHNNKLKKLINEKLFEQQVRINQSVEELEKQKEELTELNATKDKFFSIIAHDLKNPLSSMVGISDLLNSDFDKLSVSKQKTFVQLINQASNDLFKLLENLLQWSRIQTGSIPYDPNIVLLSDIVQPVISLLEPSARNKNITITNLISPSIFVFADVSMISAVLRNLIGNAVKFTNPHGHVILNAEDTGQMVKVTVSDDGVGLTEKDLLKIFRTDAKFTKRGTSDEKGTGLGLIVCKEFIEKNNGRIGALRQQERGATFWFTLQKPDATI
jgi:signal transduction histidine kinase